LSTTQENRTLDWQEREHSDRVFGNVKGKSRFFKKGEFERAFQGSEDETKFLQGEHLKDGKSSSFLDEQHVQSIAVNQDVGYGWNVEQVWGFEEIDGKRYHTRRLICKKDDKTELLRLVYDYQGPVETNQIDDDGLAYGD
jgi:hypothetical protein